MDEDEEAETDEERLSVSAHGFCIRKNCICCVRLMV